ncbi:flavocytochrome c [Fusobacterium sp. PH5-44]|uniref:flavocytochrome c n=1 Tax=unclassified Fusobacterium TaxID=2648384 RepID=UPI003D20B38B
MIKKVLLICALTSFALFGYTPGTYDGEAKGYGGQIKVKVKVSESKIEEINVLENRETNYVGTIALDKLPKEIIENQSVGVDSVAGATSTSAGLKMAIRTALEKAGGTPAEFMKKPEIAPIVKKDTEYTADVVVIGGGGAGLAAAVTAKQNGASVILIEKMPRLGGNTILSGGAYNAADPKRQKAQKIEDSTDLHYDQTFKGGDEKADPKLVRLLVDNAYPALEWLEGLGMKFNDELFTVLGGLHPRAHKPSTPVGTGFILTYKDFAEKNGIQIFYETEAKELVSKDGRIVGVKGNSKTENITFNATKGVVIATGGFGGDVEYRTKFNPNLKENILTTNHPGSDAVGIMMAEKVGANTVGMEYIQMLPMGDPRTGSLSGNIELSVEDRIFVNKEGKRFVAEDARRDVMTNALFQQPDAFMWTILDSQVYSTTDVKNNFNESIGELIAENRAVSANSIEELAEKIKVPVENLKKTIEDYNKAVDTKQDEFGRKLFGVKIEKAPFYAGGRIPTVHHTMGGLQINENAQVINKDGKIIPGLYAAGEVTGGIHGTNRLGGNALADITVFGRIAGENVAKEKIGK